MQAYLVGDIHDYDSVFLYACGAWHDVFLASIDALVVNLCILHGVLLAAHSKLKHPFEKHCCYLIPDQCLSCHGSRSSDGVSFAGAHR